LVWLPEGKKIADMCIRFDKMYERDKHTDRLMSYNGLLIESYEVYRTAPFSMTLADPKPRFQGQAIL